MKVPLVDLGLQIQALRAEIDRAIGSCVDDRTFIGGFPVQAFEREFAEWVGVEHCVACANGTDALELMLRAIRVEPGDEVIVPTLSWIATAEAVSNVGATPVFVDVEPTYYHLDPEATARAITSHTRAILAVHLYGQPAAVGELRRIADEHGLKLLEDAAQAHGAALDGKSAGAFGDAASFSFFPSKNLGAMGDAGCVVTGSEELASRVRELANHGQSGGKHNHVRIGRNSRLDSIQAAVLRVKLPHVDAWNAARIERARWYDEMLEGLPTVCPARRPNAKHIYHLYVVQSEDRVALRAFLQRHGVASAVHYPTTLPLTGAYAGQSGPGSRWAAAQSLQDRLVSLPMYPELDQASVEYVADRIRAFYG